MTPKISGTVCSTNMGSTVDHKSNCCQYSCGWVDLCHQGSTAPSQHFRLDSPFFLGGKTRNKDLLCSIFLIHVKYKVKEREFFQPTRDLYILWDAWWLWKLFNYRLKCACMTSFYTLSRNGHAVLPRVMFSYLAVSAYKKQTEKKINK